MKRLQLEELSNLQYFFKHISDYDAFKHRPSIDSHSIKMRPLQFTGIFPQYAQDREKINSSTVCLP